MENAKVPKHLGIFDENGTADLGRIAEKCTLEVRKRVVSESRICYN